MKSKRFCDACMLLGQVVCPGHNNSLQLTNLVRIRHSWFRSRCQRPQLSHNRAIRPAHCSRSHFVPARFPCLKIMSQRIKSSWLSLGETRRGRSYSALNFHMWMEFFQFSSVEIVYYWYWLVHSLCMVCCAEIANCRFCANTIINMCAAF